MHRAFNRKVVFLACSLATLALFVLSSSAAHAALGVCDTAGPIEIESSGGTVVPTGYASLTAALAAINAGTHTGTIDIEVCGNSGEGTGTAVLNASGSGSASYTAITLKPVGSWTISGATTAGNPLVDLNGADNVTIDGVNASGNSLVVANTTASATTGTSTIRFINGATSNTVTNASVQGSFSGAVTVNGGNIYFATDASTANGNDNNTVSNCDIGPAGANLPTKGVYGNGTATNGTIANSGIVINNNNIFDFFGAAVTSAGVHVAGGNTNWTITNNRFYQTATRTWTTGANHRGIDVQNSSAITSGGAQSFTITGNTIGFAAANGTGTYSLTGSTGKFAGIVFNGPTGNLVSTISNNTIASVSMTGVTSSSTSTTSPFIGILVLNGRADTNSNTLGSQGATGSLTFSTSTTTGTEVYGLFNFSVDNWISNNNNIGGITANNPTATTSTFTIFGMRANTGTGVTWAASGNNVGGTVADSIQNNATSTATTIAGMVTVNAAPNFTGNTLRNFTAAGGTGTTTAASVIGISNTSTSTLGHTLGQNSIFALKNTNASAATTVIGVHQSNSTSGANLVARNSIYGLSVASGTGLIHGINVAGGTSTFQNNMIDLGNGISASAQINGINETGGTTNVYFNSVYVGGSPAAGAVNTFAFSSTVTSNTRNYRDNIFFNARSNAGGTGKHYAIRVGGTAPNPAGLTTNNNVLFVTGSGGLVGLFNAIDRTTLGDWQTATGQDVSSFSSDPRYLDPTNATPDLHINPSLTTVVEGNGVAIGGINDDFDGQTRASLTPTDIGADAGNFSGIDLSAPAIVYTALGNTTSTSNRTLSISVTDNSGVPTAGIGLPVLYFRKGTGGAYSSSQCTFTSGSNYDCVFTYASVGGVIGGDTIQYFVAAQDNIGNVTTNPSGGAAGFTANPPAAATPPTTPNSYLIAAQISGTKTVCSSGCDYTSLTGTGGAFDVFNNGVFTGNTVLEIQGNLVANETGAVALNAFTEEPPASNYTLKIYPTGAPRAIASTTAPTGGFIRLNGADRVTIDGSLNGNGTDRSLTVSTTATGTSVAVIWLQSNGVDGATGNVVKNLVVAGNSATTTLFAIGSGSNAVGLASNGSGNHNNVYQNNLILNVQHGIYSGGASAVAKNTGTVIQDNVIDGTAPNNVGTGGIFVRFEDGVQILRNTVSNVLKHDGTTGTTGTTYGIALGLIPSNTVTTFTGSDVTNALVARNKIDALTQLNATGYSAFGIVVNSVTSGTTTVVNNAISRVRAASTASDFTAGIVVGGGTGSTTKVYFNSVAMTGSRNAATFPSYALAINSGDPTVDVRDNVFFNTQTSTSTGKSYAIATGGTTFANLTSDFNDLFLSGTNTFTGQTGGLGTAGTDRTNLAAWQAATGKDAASLAVDPIFNSASNLQPQPGSPVLDAGTPVSIVPYEDFTGATRVDPPTIGAYETGADSVAPVITYAPFGNTSSLANRVLAMTATDASGVPTAGVGLPVLYFRKGNAGPYASTQCTHAGGSAYNCTIDYSLVSGGSVAPGDTVQYYVAAQDNNGATTTNPVAGAAGFTPNPPAAATPPTPPSSYLISVLITGSVNVGTGETITSLTNAGGIFEYLNANVLGSNVTINLTSDLTAETGAVALGQLSEQGVGGYTVTFQSSAAVLRTISGTAASGLIRLNGADRIVFDGRVAGSGQFLLFRNTSTAGSTFTFLNDATGNTLESCVVEGVATSTTGGTIVFSTSTGTLGNSGNTIHACHVRDRSDAAGVPANAIYSSGSAGAPNGNNTVSGCNVFNYTNAGVLVAAAGAGDGWTVNPSHFYQTGSRTLPAVGISIMGGSGHNVNSNSIGGSAPGAGGAFWATSSTFRGIDLAVGSGTATSVQGNVIRNIRSTYAATDFASSYGIFIESGRVNLGTSTGNTVGSANVAERMEFNGDCYAIRVVSTTTANVSNNSVNNFTTRPAGAGGPPTGEFYFGMSVEGAAGAHTVENNTITNVTNASTPDGSFSTQTIGLVVSASGAQTVRGNAISNIGSTVTTATGAAALNNRVWGMVLSGTGVGTVVEKNIISNIYASSASTGARLDVITCMQSQANSTIQANGTYTNNFISTDSGTGSTERSISGILELSATGSSTYAFNSVNITGTASGTANTYAFQRNGTQTVTLRNNIFADTRTGGTGFHVAMANTNAAATGWNAAASNNNLLYNVTAAHITQWLGGAVGNNQTLAGFQAASGGDAASLSGNPLFISASNLHLDPFGPASPAENAGVTFGGITTDIDGDTRAAVPDIGADELRCHAGVDVSCDDGSTCTNDSCNPATGCANVPGNAGTECRASAGGCDVAESCDGVSAACPADVLVPGGTECRASLGACDPAESCSGISPLCPGDALSPAGTECRPSSGQACDPAEVCTGSDVTCPKDTVNANAPLGPTVTLSKSGPATVISWTEIEPGPFNVYRGFRDVGVAWAYNQTCFDPEVAGSSSSDATTPPSTRTFFYLISRVAPPCTESTLGEDSNGNDRPNPASCPAFAPDNDLDTVEDAFDNCPFSVNPTQLDTDRDGRGDACDPCPDGEGCEMP